MKHIYKICALILTIYVVALTIYWIWFYRCCGEGFNDKAVCQSQLGFFDKQTLNPPDSTPLEKAVIPNNLITNIEEDYTDILTFNDYFPSSDWHNVYLPSDSAKNIVSPLYGYSLGDDAGNLNYYQGGEPKAKAINEPNGWFLITMALIIIICTTTKGK